MPMTRARALARYGLGGDEDAPQPGEKDQTIQTLTFPAWVPKLTEATTTGPAGTYVSIHDYNLLIARANTRNMTNMFVSAGVGFLVGWGLVRMYGRR